MQDSKMQDDKDKVFIAGEGQTVIARKQYSDRLDLKHVRVADSVKEISPYAFYGCSALESIEFPDTLMEISSEAFKNCKSLKSVVLPPRLSDCGMWLFAGCDNLTSVTCNGSLPDGGMMFENCVSLKNVNIKSIKSLGCYTFENCRSLTEINIPEDTDAIYGQAFSGCSALKRITIPKSVTYIDDNAFANCTALTEVKIESDELRINELAFAGCTSLKSINISSGTKLGLSVFFGCKNLKKIDLAPDHPLYYMRDDCIFMRDDDTLVWTPDLHNLPTGVKRIGGGLLYCNTDITSYTVPDGVEALDYFCFASSALKEITLPASLKFISLDAFDDCRELRKIHFKGTRYEWNAIDIDTDDYHYDGNDEDWNLYLATEYSSYTEVICTDDQD